MKKIFFSMMAAGSIMLLMLSSCKKDETKVYSSLGNAGNLTASTTTPALSKPTAENTAVTFNWPATPVSGSAGTVTYTLQVDKKGNNFKLPREIAAAGTTTAVKVGDLNKALLNLGLVIDAQAQVEVRLKSSIAPNTDAAYSNAVTLTVTPYSAAGFVYLPGAYQGWSPATAPKLESPLDNKVYDGVVTVPSTVTNFEFKVATKPNWDESFGGASGQLSASGANLVFPGTGTFKLHVDLNSFTYTITKQ
ncbi:SusE domain-containing protein [uncultured Mucilaginibacter sp.]|uniref:SusE domain-containing protein n=1 Tax=uncultured Mucilaginibacter sp. TaxID=797541 RepID=UPI0025E9E1E5|nr:SusE domain-containing protein [uncultured Mucilaginibacter sp.]